MILFFCDYYYNMDNINKYLKKKGLIIKKIGVIVLFILFLYCVLKYVNNISGSNGSNDSYCSNGTIQLLLSNNNFTDTIDNSSLFFAGVGAISGAIDNGIRHVFFSENSIEDIYIGNSNYKLYQMDGVNAPSIMTSSALTFENGTTQPFLVKGYNFSKLTLLLKIKDFNEEQYGIILQNDIYEIRIHKTLQNIYEIHILYIYGTNDLVLKLSDNDLITKGDYYMLQLEFIEDDDDE